MPTEVWLSNVIGMTLCQEVCLKTDYISDVELGGAPNDCADESSKVISNWGAAAPFFLKLFINRDLAYTYLYQYK